MDLRVPSRSRQAFLLLLLVGILLPPAARGEGPSIGLSAGAFDPNERSEALELGFEYRFRLRVHRIVPHVGLHVTEDEAIFAYAGIRWDPRIGSFILSPSFAFSAYEAGDGKQLGTTLEFRSGLDVGRRFRRGAQITVGIYHLSNGGLSDVNPGVNSLLLTYAVPVGKRE